MIAVLALIVCGGCLFALGWVCHSIAIDMRTCTYCYDPRTHPHPDGGPGGVCDRHAEALREGR